ncbi:MAG: YybH family protein, partial [Steroidobacteraceae bacterium]
MRRYNWVLFIALAGLAACTRTADVGKEREALLAADRAWSDSTTDAEKFHSFFAADASVYPPWMLVVTCPEAIRDVWAQMSSAPGFAIKWTPEKAVVGASGDVGYTTGTYEMTAEGATERGKYVTVWKKQSDGSWKVVEDIFNANETAKPTPSQHAVVAA